MIDLYYKASSEEELLSAVPAEMHPVGEDFINHSHGWSWDWDVPHEITEAKYDEENNLLTSAVLSDDFHANLRLVDEGVDVSTLEQFEVKPQTPDRKWA